MYSYICEIFLSHQQVWNEFFLLNIATLLNLTVNSLNIACSCSGFYKTSLNKMSNLQQQSNVSILYE